VIFVALLSQVLSDPFPHRRIDQFEDLRGMERSVNRFENHYRRKLSAKVSEEKSSTLPKASHGGEWEIT
jgi:hypothetical protein